MKKLDDYFKENFVFDWINFFLIVKFFFFIEEEVDDVVSMIGSVNKGMKYRFLFNRFILEKIFKSEEEYKVKIWELWKDLNKCWYLRIFDEMLDLFGVNILVKD